MNNMLMPQQGAALPSADGPQASPGAQVGSVSPQQLSDARVHMAVMMKDLAALAAKPPGSLSKQDLFNAAAEMIAQGAFSTPQSRQQLVAQIAQIPDNETAIRQAIGGHLMQLVRAQDLIHQHFGPGE